MLAFILYVETDRVIEVTYTETLRGHRGRGHMYGLFSNLLQGFSEKMFWLDVHEENRPARQLYEKLGFKNNGLRHYLGVCPVMKWVAQEWFRNDFG